MYIYQNRWTPLHKAAHEGHIDVMKVLVAEGADIEAKDGVSDRLRMRICASLYACVCAFTSSLTLYTKKRLLSYYNASLSYFCFDINYCYFSFLASFSSHYSFLLFSLSYSVTLSHLLFLLLFAYRMLFLSCNLPSCLSFLSTSIPLLPLLSLLYFCYILLICDYLFCLMLHHNVRNLR